jgi:hypothetical protein
MNDQDYTVTVTTMNHARFSGQRRTEPEARRLYDRGVRTGKNPFSGYRIRRIELYAPVADGGLLLSAHDCGVPDDDDA